MTQLVLLRHGESVWNQQNIFTGWTDVALSDNGRLEAHRAGRILHENALVFDVAFSSVLARATETLAIVLEELDLMCIPVKLEWRLNERHYGALQGLNKAETAEKYGHAQVKQWRRSYQTRPIALDDTDPRCSKHDKRYQLLRDDQIPNTESLEDLEQRILPCWNDCIVPELRKDRRVLIVAHGNSLRALVKHLDSISNEGIIELNIPTGIPLIYQLDKELHATSHRYLNFETASQTRSHLDLSAGTSKQLQERRPLQ
ncbi:MAG: 2,3-diphosphoglycerate-dependent phosphoglycerate mutase [Proteobacteria bacterium]|nr:2,3-diphosphoglycerate-dependent phosphoglycerate mutase [Pseudomonadota bacterium]